MGRVHNLPNKWRAGHKLPKWTQTSNRQPECACLTSQSGISLSHARYWRVMQNHFAVCKKWVSISAYYCQVFLVPSIFTCNPFILECMKWTLPSPNLVTSSVTNRWFSQKINNRMANNADPDLDLHCLQRYVYMHVLICKDKRDSIQWTLWTSNKGHGKTIRICMLISVFIT